MKKKKEKPKLSREERRWNRLEKGRRWLLENNNLNKPHLVSRYRKHMRLDLPTAMKDLEELGARYNGGDEKVFRMHQESLQYDVRMEPYSAIVETSSDEFSYIDDYISGGAPIGVTWQAVGIDPDLPYEEKVKLYAAQLDEMYTGISDDFQDDFTSDELPF